MDILLVGDNIDSLDKIEELFCDIDIQNLNINKLSYESKDVSEIIYDIAIVDYKHINLAALSFINSFRKFNNTSSIIVIIPSYENVSIQIDLFKLGVTDFLKKPLNKKLFHAKIVNIIRYKHNNSKLINESSFIENKINELMKDVSKREIETLNVISKLAEFRDTDTNKHVERVALYCKIIAKEYGLDEEFQQLIYKAAPLHDIGKVGIPDYILLKPGKLSVEEWELMKTHCKIGFDILSKTESQILQAGATIAITHHEKYNGTGYPFKLAYKAIPLIGRIVAIADVFDALSSKRAYKDAWSLEDAFNEIKNQSGEQFDPELIKCFLNKKVEIKEINLNFKE